MAITVDLIGRRLLVTGASSGIGEATCRALVGCGARVAMLARREDRLAQLHAELGERAIGIPCDVTDLGRLEGGIAQTVDALGGWTVSSVSPDAAWSERSAVAIPHCGENCWIST